MANGFNINAALRVTQVDGLDAAVRSVQDRFRNSKIDLELGLSSRADASLKKVEAAVKSIGTSASNALGDVRGFASAVGSIRLDDRVSNAAGGMSRNFRRLTQDARDASRAVEQVKSQAELAGEAFGATARRFGVFLVVSHGFNALAGSIGDSIKQAVGFQHEMTRLSQIGGTSAAAVADVQKEISRLATTMGASSKELAEVSVTLRQAGLSASETKTALDALAKTSLAPTFESLRSTTEGVVALRQQFGVTAADFEKRLGSINTVAGEFAVESEDIVTAIKKTGGAFRAAAGDMVGNEQAFHQLISLFTSVRDTTRESADEIATGMRTIFARVQSNSVVNALAAMNVNLRYSKEEARQFGQEVEGRFVGAYEAVRRLSEATKNIPTTDPRYAQIVEQLGGFRQISRVIPLLQQFSTAQRAYTSAQAGANSLSVDAAKAQDSLLVKTDKLKESLAELVRTFADNKGVRTMIESTLELATALVQLTKSLEPVVPLLAVIGGAKLFSGLRDFGRGAVRKFAEVAPAEPVRRQRGGVVPGSGRGDHVPIDGEQGAYVLNRAASLAIGHDTLEDMRAGRFQAGGPVRKKVPVLAEPGEFYFTADEADRIGRGRLDRMNRTGELDPRERLARKIKAMGGVNAMWARKAEGGPVDVEELRRLLGPEFAGHAEELLPFYSRERGFAQPKGGKASAFGKVVGSLIPRASGSVASLLDQIRSTEDRGELENLMRQINGGDAPANRGRQSYMEGVVQTPLGRELALRMARSVRTQHATTLESAVGEGSGRRRFISHDFSKGIAKSDRRGTVGVSYENDSRDAYDAFSEVDEAPTAEAFTPRPVGARGRGSFASRADASAVVRSGLGSRLRNRDAGAGGSSGVSRGDTGGNGPGYTVHLDVANLEDLERKISSSVDTQSRIFTRHAESLKSITTESILANDKNAHAVQSYLSGPPRPPGATRAGFAGRPAASGPTQDDAIEAFLRHEAVVGGVDDRPHVNVDGPWGGVREFAASPRDLPGPTYQSRRDPSFAFPPDVVPRSALEGSAADMRRRLGLDGIPLSDPLKRVDPNDYKLDRLVKSYGGIPPSSPPARPRPDPESYDFLYPEDAIHLSDVKGKPRRPDVYGFEDLPGIRLREPASGTSISRERPLGLFAGGVTANNAASIAAPGGYGYDVDGGDGLASRRGFSVTSGGRFRRRNPLEIIDPGEVAADRRKSIARRLNVLSPSEVERDRRVSRAGILGRIAYKIQDVGNIPLSQLGVPANARDGGEVNGVTRGLRSFGSAVSRPFSAASRGLSRFNESGAGRLVRTGAGAVAAASLLTDYLGGDEPRGDTVEALERTKASRIRNAGVTFAAAGYQAGALSGVPGGAVIGGLIGGLYGLANAVKTVNREIGQIKLDDSLKRLGRVIDDVTQGRTGGAGFASGANSYIGGVRANAAEAVGPASLSWAETFKRSFLTTGADLTDAEKRKSLDALYYNSEATNADNAAAKEREALTPLLPSMVQAFQASILKGGALTPEMTKVGGDVDRQRADRRRAILDNGGGELIANIARVQKTSFDDVLGRIDRELVQESRARNTEDAGVKSADLMDADVRRFEALGHALEAATQSVRGFGNAADAIEGLATGRAFSASPSSFLDRTKLIGGIDPTAAGDVSSFISGSLGGAGNDFSATLREMDDVKRTLATRLTEAARGGGFSEDGITGELSKAFDGFSSGTKTRLQTRLNAIDPRTVLRELTANPEKLAADLSTVFDPVSKSTESITGEIQNAFGRYGSGLERGNALRNQAAETEDGAVGVDRGRRRLKRDFDRSVSGADPGLDLEAELAPSRSRIDRLTRSIGTSDPTAIGDRLRDIQARSLGVRKAIDDPKTEQKARQDAQKSLLELSDESKKLQDALRGLADSSDRVASIQEKIAEAEKARESKLGLVERLLTGDPSANRDFGRGLTAARVAGEQGGFSGFSAKNARLALESLRAFGDIKFEQGPFAGRTGNEAARGLLGSSSNGIAPLLRDFLGADVGVAGSDRKIAGLFGEADSELALGGKAGEALAKFQGDQARSFFDSLEKGFDEFFANAARSLGDAREKDARGTGLAASGELERRKSDLGRVASVDREFGFGGGGGLSRARRLLASPELGDLSTSLSSLKVLDAASGRKLDLTKTGLALDPSRAASATDADAFLKDYSPRIDAARTAAFQQTGAPIDVVDDATARFRARVRSQISTASSLSGFDAEGEFSAGLGEAVKQAQGRHVDRANAARSSIGYNVFGNVSGPVAGKIDEVAGGVDAFRERLKGLDRYPDLESASKGVAEQDRVARAASEELAKTIRENTDTLKNRAVPVAAKAGGGTVFRPRGTDTVPAMLTPGEEVIPADVAEANRPLLRSLRAQYRAGGGPISTSLSDDEKKRRDAERLRATLAAYDEAQGPRDRLRDDTLAAAALNPKAFRGPSDSYLGTIKERFPDRVAVRPRPAARATASDAASAVGVGDAAARPQPARGAVSRVAANRIGDGGRNPYQVQAAQAAGGGVADLAKFNKELAATATRYLEASKQIATAGVSMEKLATVLAGGPKMSLESNSNHVVTINLGDMTDALKKAVVAEVASKIPTIVADEFKKKLNSMPMGT